MTESELPQRPAGRVIAIDPAGRVLLFFYDDPPPKGRHWSTPGGGLEDGEDFHAAARRELFEETGWGDVPVSAEEVLVDSNVQWSNLNGSPALCRQHDHYFVGRVPDEERRLGDVAAMHTSDGIVSHRWWTIAELEAAGEDIYPPGLADLVRRFGTLSSGFSGQRDSLHSPVSGTAAGRRAAGAAGKSGRAVRRRLTQGPGAAESRPPPAAPGHATGRARKSSWPGRAAAPGSRSAARRRPGRPG